MVCDPPMQQKRVSKEASIASMCTRTQKWAPNHRAWFQILSKCVFGSEWVRHRGGSELPAAVGAYRQWANGVDSANQLALEHRETGRFRRWTRALKAFLFRYAIVNTFIVCRLQGLIPKKTSLWDFQWDISENFVSMGHGVHTPVLVDTRGTFKVCKGRTWFKCALCNVHLHS